MSEQRPSKELVEKPHWVPDNALRRLIRECDNDQELKGLPAYVLKGICLDLLDRRTTHEPPATLCVDPAFDGTRCPFTKLPYFMHLDHPELGRVPTYGGPYDSYTIPVPDDDNERTLRSERYDHDEGAWIEGGMPWPMNLVTNEEFVDLHTLREERASQPPSGLRDQMWAYLDAIGAPRDGLAKQSINAFLMWMEDRTSETKPESPEPGRSPSSGLSALPDAENIGQPSGETRAVQDTDKLAWCVRVHEDLALYIKDSGGDMIHTRAHRALGIMFTEIEKLEKALWPLTK